MKAKAIKCKNTRKDYAQYSISKNIAKKSHVITFKMVSHRPEFLNTSKFSEPLTLISS